MNNLTKYTTSDLSNILKRINEYSIGMDEYFDRLFNLHETTTNYPPYNLIQLNNCEVKLEIALAGFKKSEINVYTQDGKLFVDGKKEDKDSEVKYYHRAVAQRSFIRSWTLSDDTEVLEVSFDDGLLTIRLGKIVPEHHARKDYI